MARKKNLRFGFCIEPTLNHGNMGRIFNEIAEIVGAEKWPGY